MRGTGRKRSVSHCRVLNKRKEKGDQGRRGKFTWGEVALLSTKREIGPAQTGNPTLKFVVRRKKRTENTASSNAAGSVRGWRRIENVSL